jgi:serine/threonine-protein kinase
MAAELPEKFGRFRVVGELGQGAMGIVYRAEDPALARPVAIKTIALTGDARERDTQEARFLQEARAAGGVSHPAVVTIYEVGREGDVAFIAMELLDGRELRDFILERSLAPVQAVGIAAMVAEGLAAAHARGVIHRDVKPGNIMVLADGRVKIMDFGIAHLNESSVKTQTGIVLGSPQYMSPEQIAGRGMDHRSDIFSLGAVLYEMLTGTRPFEGEGLTQLFFAIANSPVTPASQVVRGLPPVVDYVIARALKKNPQERYATAAEFAADLRDCAVQITDAPPSIALEGARQADATKPDAAIFNPAGTLTSTLTLAGGPLEFRTSPRFAAAKGIARLVPMSASGGGRRSPGARHRPDRTRMLIAAAYVVATLTALAIVFS